MRQAAAKKLCHACGFFATALNEETHAVELVYAGQSVAVTETAASFYNERQRVEIDLIKCLMKDEAYGIGKNGEIFDVTFGLYAEKELTAADGTVIPADGMIEIISLDGNGSGKVKTDLPIVSYYVKELATNSAYILNGQKYPVVSSMLDRKRLRSTLQPMAAKPLRTTSFTAL